MIGESGEAIPQRQTDDVTERLQRIGISFRPISPRNASMVTNRDAESYYSSIHTGNTFFPVARQQRGLFIGDYLVGFSFAGLAEEEGKRVGEVSITHVSPPVRDLGLGSLLSTTSRKWLVESGADLLRSKVLDTTGKVKHLLQKQGFNSMGQRGGNDVWERVI